MVSRRSPMWGRRYREPPAQPACVYPWARKRSRSSSATRYERPTRTAGSEPALINRYTVMVDTRMTAATSAAVRYRARACTRPTPLRSERHCRAALRRRGRAGRLRLAELAGALGGGRDGVEQGRPHAGRLEGPEAGGG